MSKMPAHFPPALLRRARENISGELAWQYPFIAEVVSALAAQEYAILGGDVMNEESGKLDYYHEGVYCGNWYLNWRQGQSWTEYVAESVATTMRYIEAYARRNGESYWYMPVFMSEEAYGQLLGRIT